MEIKQNIISNNLPNDFEFHDSFRLDRLAKIGFPIAVISASAATAASIVAVLLLPGSAFAITALVVSSISISILLISKAALLLKPYLNERLQNIIDTIEAHVKETFATLAFIATFLFPASLFDRMRAAPNGKTPLLMIHGFFHNSSCWHYPIHRLKNHSGPISTVNLGHPLHPIEEYVLFAAERIAELTVGKDNKDLNLCGHSMGGIISCYLAEHIHDLHELEAAFTDENLKERAKAVANKVKDVNIKKVISIASPLNGTNRTGMLEPLKIRCVQQMQLESEFSNYLVNKVKVSTKEIQYLHFGAVQDLLVQPISSTLIEKENHKNIILKKHGHLSPIFSDAMLDEIIRFIR